MKDFLVEVREQGRALRAAAEAYRDAGAASMGNAARLAGDRPVLFAGMGSSWAAALAVQAFLVRRGRLAMAVDAADALYRWLPVLNGARGVAPVLISQSGESQELVRLAARLSSPFIAITNVPESTLGRRAAVVLPLHAGHEKGVTNKTFLNTIAVGLILGRAILADGAEEKISEMARLLEIAEFLEAAAAVDAILARADGPVKDILGHLTAGEAAGGPLATWEIVGRGSGMAAAEQSALVLRELTGRIVAAFAGGFYRHGPVYRVGPWTRAIILAAREEEGSLLAGLAGEIVEKGGRVAFISDFDPEIDSPLLVRAAIPEVARCLFPILAMVPLELLAAADAAARGFRAGQEVPKLTPIE
jgi:glucosamine--fructose-6-phosphate aminotransferase (isomerizing)